MSALPFFSAKIWKFSSQGYSLTVYFVCYIIPHTMFGTNVRKHTQVHDVTLLQYNIVYPQHGSRYSLLSPHVCSGDSVNKRHSIEEIWTSIAMFRLRFGLLECVVVTGCDSSTVSVSAVSTQHQQLKVMRTMKMPLYWGCPSTGINLALSAPDLRRSRQTFGHSNGSRFHAGGTSKVQRLRGGDAGCGWRMLMG